MKKNKKIIITVLIAIAFAIAAGVAAYLVLSPARTTMYVFNGSYRAGTILKDDMLTPIQADSNIVLAGARARADSYFVTQKQKDAIIASGDSLKTDVTEGTALMTSMLVAISGNSIEMSMSPSKIAVTVNINNITGITNELAAGSSVNVYITGTGMGTYLLFENMRLLEVFKDSTGNLTAATLEVTNDQAMQLLDAATMGSVYLGLVNSGSYQYINTPATEQVETQAPPEMAPITDQTDQAVSEQEGPGTPAEGEAGPAMPDETDG